MYVEIDTTNERAKASSTENWYSRLVKKHYSDLRYNGTQAFWDIIKQYCDSPDRVLVGPLAILELGSGPSNNTTAYLGTLGEVTGLDIDKRVLDNQYCKEAIVYDGKNIPLSDNSFDIVVMDFVLEHVEEPTVLMAEIRRVMKVDGVLLFRTPNLCHYVSLAAFLLPHKLHDWIIPIVHTGARQGGNDVYKTFHRMNTKHKCSSILTKAGFEIEKIDMIEPAPSYCLNSRILFYIMMVWERILNSTALLSFLRANILCAARAREEGL